MREWQEILLVSIDLLGPIHVMVEDKLKHSLRKCRSLREILSLLLCEVRMHPDFGQPDSVEELQRYFLLLVNNSPVEASMIDAQLGSEDRVTIVSLSHGG